MKRRLFSALFASAPVGLIPVDGPAPLTAPNKYANSLMGLAVGAKSYTPSPLEMLQRKNAREYQNAVEKANQLVYRRIQSGTELRANHNIMALRSVAPQHKAHMFMEWERSLHEEHKSWAQRLAESLGVVERNDGVYPAEAGKSTNW